jgi:hypothetical protein
VVEKVKLDYQRPVFVERLVPPKRSLIVAGVMLVGLLAFLTVGRVFTGSGLSLGEIVRSAPLASFLVTVAISVEKSFQTVTVTADELRVRKPFRKWVIPLSSVRKATLMKEKKHGLGMTLEVWWGERKWPMLLRTNRVDELQAALRGEPLERPVPVRGQAVEEYVEVLRTKWHDLSRGWIAAFMVVAGILMLTPLAHAYWGMTTIQMECVLAMAAVTAAGLLAYLRYRFIEIRVDASGITLRHLFGERKVSADAILNCDWINHRESYRPIRRERERQYIGEMYSMDLEDSVCVVLDEEMPLIVDTERPHTLRRCILSLIGRTPPIAEPAPLPPAKPTAGPPARRVLDTSP